MSFVDIELALQTELNSVTNLPAVAWPNIEFKPILGTPFIVPTVLSTQGQLYTLKDFNRYSGIFQIDIHVPFGKGIKPLYDIADSIRIQFQNNKKLMSNSQTVFIQHIDPTIHSREDAWYRGILNIHFISYN